jgi:hypothetical protein
MYLVVRNSWCIRLLLVVVCVAALWRLDEAFAGKPGGGGTHTSLILYSTWRTPATIYQMYEDGTWKSVALTPGVYGVPSSRTYGGSRWWLGVDIDPNTGFTEVFAFRGDGSAHVQLTELGAAGIQVGDQPRWSNDLGDTCVTAQVGWDADPVDGTNETYVLRLPISGADVALIGSGLKFRLTGADCEVLLAIPAASPDDSSSYGGYACSSDPSKLAYVMNNFYSPPGGRTIWVRTLIDPPVEDVPVHTAEKLNLAAWSHDGSRIAFYTVNASSYGGVWTIKPDGSGLLQVKTNNGTMSYMYPHWSPDSKELLVMMMKSRIGDWYYDLARLPASGGTLTVLTKDLPQTLGKSPEAWLPLSP